MKIAYFVPSLKQKGPIRQLINIAKYQPKDVKILLLVLRDTPQNSLRSAFEELDRSIEIQNIDSDLLSCFFKLNNLKKTLQEYKIDVLHTQGFHTDLLTAFLKVNIPTVSTLRNNPQMDYPAKFGKIRGKVMAYLHVWATKKINKPVACSRSIKQDWSTFCSRELDVIQNGVDTEKFNQNNEGHTPHSGVTFVAIGSLIKRKNLSVLVNAFSEFKNEVRLLIVGEGPEKEHLESIASLNVEFIGQKNDVVPYYRMADFLISSSLSEGLPNSVLESMACKTPVILSDIESHKELFQGIDYRLFFDSKNKESVKNAIQLAMDSDKKYLNELVFEQVKQYFDAKLNANNYHAQYKKLSNGK